MQRPQLRAEDNSGWQRAGGKVGVLPSIPPTRSFLPKVRAGSCTSWGTAGFSSCPQGRLHGIHRWEVDLAVLPEWAGKE